MYKLFVFYSRRPFFPILSFIVAVSGDCSKIKPKNNLGQEISQTGALELIKPTQVKGMPPTNSSKKGTTPSKEGSSPIQATNMPSTSTPSNGKEAIVPSKGADTPIHATMPSTSPNSNGKGTTIPSQGIGSPIQATNMPSTSNKKEAIVPSEEASSSMQATNMPSTSNPSNKEETKLLSKGIIKIPNQGIVFVVKENSSIEHIITANQSMLPYLQKAEANQTEVVVTNRKDAPQVRKHLAELWKWIVEYRQCGNHQNVLNTKIKEYDLKETPNSNNGSSANSGSFFVLIKKKPSKGADSGQEEAT